MNRKPKPGTTAGYVYSTDPSFKLEETPEAQHTLPAAEQLLRVRLDTRQRAGKPVTTIEGFNGTVADLETLGRLLKTHCGTGGSVKDGIAIIQGDQRDKVLGWLLAKGYKKTRKM